MTYMHSITEAIIPSTRVTCPSMCTLFTAYMSLDAIHYNNSITLVTASTTLLEN